MVFLRKSNYVSIDGLHKRIITKQASLLSKYAVESEKNFLEIASPEDQIDWQTLRKDLDLLKPFNEYIEN